jgi:polysaccharide pyruvyl transferase WcaK-like protein
LEGIGVDTGQDPVVPDLVFGLPAEELASYLMPTTPPKTIGVGVMGYYGWSNDKQEGRKIYESYIAKMTKFVLWLLDRGYEVRLLLGQLNADEGPIGDVLDAVAAQASAESNRRLSAPRIDSLDGLLRGIAATDTVVATRYHNVICALVLGRPVISIGYASKFDALMRQVGLESYCQHIEELNVDRLIEQFLDLTRNHAWAAELVRAKSAVFRQRLQGMYDSLFGRGAAGEKPPRAQPEVPVA